MSCKHPDWLVGSFRLEADSYFWWVGVNSTPYPDVHSSPDVTVCCLDTNRKKCDWETCLYFLPKLLLFHFQVGQNTSFLQCLWKRLTLNIYQFQFKQKYFSCFVVTSQLHPGSKPKENWKCEPQCCRKISYWCLMVGAVITWRRKQ